MICHECGVRETRGTHKLCYECNPADHGEARKYSAGCRCDACRTAAHEQELLRGFSYLTSKSPHGTPQKYRNGCRCELCTVASREHRRFKPHGMTPIIYAQIMEIEDDACPVCQVLPDEASATFHIDHTHGCMLHGDSKISCEQCWRGILCEPCNINLERKVGHAYLRELGGLPPTEEDVRVLDYIRNPPAGKWRELHQIA